MGPSNQKGVTVARDRWNYMERHPARATAVIMYLTNLTKPRPGHCDEKPQVNRLFSAGEHPYYAPPCRAGVSAPGRRRLAARRPGPRPLCTHSCVVASATSPQGGRPERLFSQARILAATGGGTPTVEIRSQVRREWFRHRSPDLAPIHTLTPHHPNVRLMLYTGKSQGRRVGIRRPTPDLALTLAGCGYATCYSSSPGNHRHQPGSWSDKPDQAPEVTGYITAVQPNSVVPPPRCMWHGGHRSRRR
jgi:hypothetical protein